MFSKTKSIVDFIKSNGGYTMDLVRNPHTQKRFFTLPGTSVQGRVSEKVGGLSANLSVSWFTPDEGEPSWLVHPTSRDNVIDSFSID
jgi:hypothetical protein